MTRLAKTPTPDDPLALTTALVRCASVTGHRAQVSAALDLIAAWANGLGGQVQRVPRAQTDNLYVRFGTAAPNLCFAGHVDVVPVGDADAWRHDPFGAVQDAGWLYGRGAEDMKSGVACWMAATARALDAPGARQALATHGSISLLITGDEEGPATDGTAALVDWIRDTGEDIDSCLVGEPTNPQALGDAIKIGRRGSLSAFVTLSGVQGHAAYPDRAANPVHPLVTGLAALTAQPLDAGTAHFDPSSLQVVSVDVGNPATNVIPSTARATLNVRFNDQHSADSLKRHVAAAFETACAGTGVTPAFEWQANADAFLCPPKGLAEKIAAACHAVTGRKPTFSTSGGTSDARFIKDIAHVAEFGMVGRSMHQVDERIWIEDLEVLTAIYGRLIDSHLAGTA